MYKLNLEKQIVGVSTFCNYPLQVKQKTKVGSFSQPSMEKILSLKPDIVFVTRYEQAFVIKQLEQLKLNYLVCAPTNMDTLFKVIESIAAATNRKKEAQILICEMKQQLSKLKSKIANVPVSKRPKVFVEIWHDPLMTVGQDSFIDELVNLAGGINITSDISRAYTYVSPEQVIARNPDFILLGYMLGAVEITNIKKRLGWQQITAVKKGNIISDINPDLLLRPGPRLMEGMSALYERLYENN